MVATGWTKADIVAYALADNKLALNAGWDEALLAIETNPSSYQDRGSDHPGCHCHRAEHSKDPHTTRRRAGTSRA